MQKAIAAGKTPGPVGTANLDKPDCGDAPGAGRFAMLGSKVECPSRASQTRAVKSADGRMSSFNHGQGLVEFTCNALTPAPEDGNLQKRLHVETKRAHVCANLH